MTAHVPANTALYLDATAGLRLVRPLAAKTLLSVAAATMTKRINTAQHVKVLSAVHQAVISGDDEAFYFWLAINRHALFHPARTAGALDMGGASVEAAFQDQSAKWSPYQFTFKGRHYTIVTFSWLGGGLDQARVTMNGYFPSNRAVCFPRGLWSAYATRFQPKVNYHFAACEHNAEAFLSQQLAHRRDFRRMTMLLSTKPAMPWFASAGFYFVVRDLKANSVMQLKQHAMRYNGQSWQAVKKQGGVAVPLIYLEQKLFSAAYQYAFLSFLLQQHTDRVSFQKNIDWTAGVALNHFFHWH